VFTILNRAGGGVGIGEDGGDGGEAGGCAKSRLCSYLYV